MEMDEDNLSSQNLEDGMTYEEGVNFLAALLAASDHSDNEVALQRIGSIIDFSEVLLRPDGIDVAITRGNALFARDLATNQQAVLHYYLSNAWEAKRRLTREGAALHEWEQPEVEKEIIHLRSAVKLARVAGLESDRLCQIYTNLGNLLSQSGRIVDAIASWDRAIALNPDFAMAIGNRGFGLMHYARLVHDPGHKALHLREAYAFLKLALAPHYANQLHPEAREGFSHALDQVVRYVPEDVLAAPAHEHKFPNDMLRQERLYWSWCLKERLFLNDLNDIYADPIAAADVLTLPSITTSVNAPQPNAIGFYNQLKQEYVSARYLYYEGSIDDRAVHFSDRDVTLINTLDYPAYGLAVEKVKIAFRIAYSLLDKVAYFLNDYLGVGVPEKRVSFRGLWYNGQDAKQGLSTKMHRPYNGPLKGLFFLAKDLYEKDSGFTEAMEPDARELAHIRNHLEHKYFKLHLFRPSRRNDKDYSPWGFDNLAYSMERTEFQRRTLRLLLTAREALIYLSQVVHVEEHNRQANTGKKRREAAIQMDVWEDDWKF